MNKLNELHNVPEYVITLFNDMHWEYEINPYCKKVRHYADILYASGYWVSTVRDTFELRELAEDNIEKYNRHNPVTNRIFNINNLGA